MMMTAPPMAANAVTVDVVGSRGYQEKAALCFAHVENVEQHQDADNTELSLPLHAVLPRDFSDMYTSDILADPHHLNDLGRPLFTERAIVDWGLNDIRSLLIVEQLRPEWRGCLPKIKEKGYRLVHLPLDASDDEIVNTLVNSDIYKEHGFDRQFLIQSAQYTVSATRDRSNSGTAALTKPEWRNIIENYQLNLACEAQCRLDYKRACTQLKRSKQSQQASSPPKTSTSPLLRQALLASAPEIPPELKHSMAHKRVSLSQQEKQTIWVQVQSQLYRRLGLDWEADELV
jgi:hypothetical protein